MRGKRLTKQAAALAIAVAALAGCSSSSGGSTQGSTGALPGGNPPAPSSPSPVSIPSPTGPALHGDYGDTKFKAQVITVGTSVAIPKVAAPTGKTTLLVRLRVTSDPENRTSRTPLPMAWEIDYSACENTTFKCGSVDDGSTYVSEADVRARRSGAMGASELNADTAYYTYIWKFVPENADLHDAKLCMLGAANCIPLGPVAPLASQDVASIEIHKY